jgi:hypothetical protein
MKFGDLINCIFSIIINPSKNWKQKCLQDEFKKSSFVALLISTFSFLFTIYFFYSFIFLNESGIKSKILNIFFSISIDIIYFSLLFFSLKYLFKIFNISISNSSILIILYTTLFSFICVLLILKLFIEVFFLAIIGLYGFYVLYKALQIYLQLDSKKIIIIYIIIISLMIGYYIILQLIKHNILL